MSQDDTTAGPAPVSAEPTDHDGVLEMADSQDDRYTDAVLDQGYSPEEREHHVGRFGLTPDEEREGEPLDERLAQEEPEVDADTSGTGGSAGPGNGELSADGESDGELLDDEVGGVRAGRLVDPDQGAGTDREKDLVGTDVGIDGGAASAEEAAVHVVADPEDDVL